MKFDAFSGNRRSRRQNPPTHSPAIIESLESRALLAAAPQIVTPTGTITDSTPVISWEAVDGASSYDVWVTDVETRDVLFVRTGLTNTFITAPSELHLGRNRIWARANFPDDSTTGWGTPTDVLLQVPATITGPVNAGQPATPFKINDTTPAITWSSPPGARSFEIFFSNQTERTSVNYRVANLTPRLDEDGNTIPDGEGDVRRDEIRSFDVPNDLKLGQYRVFIRTTDDAGRVSAWSDAYNFEVAPTVRTLRPSGPSFQNPPLLEWAAVPGATHYEVWVSKVGIVNERTSLYPARYLTTTSFQIPSELATGNYVFWVRARRLHQVTEIDLKGTPTTGTFQITLTTFGKDGKTSTTGPIAYNATTAEVKAAIVAIRGFENVEVVTSGTAPNVTHLLQIPQTSGTVRVSVASAVSPGTVTASTTTSPEVVGLWSVRKDFSTLQNPVITGPVGVDTNNPDVRTVTDVRPTIEWTAIDKAGRYEIWIDRTASSSVYLRTTSSTNSYKFATDIPAGNYWVWVRALSTTGEATGWSTPYKFTASGGAPVITSPVNSQVLSVALPTIRWAGVPDAASYEIHIAWLGVDFDYIQVTGIPGTNYTLLDPLNTGNYRVWVRAINADGKALNWSDPVSFSVVDADSQDSGIPGDSVLVVLESEFSADAELNPQAAVPPVDGPPVETEVVTAEEARSTRSMSVSEEVAPADQVAPTVATESEVIQQLAEICTSQEWWTVAEKSNS